VVAAAPREAPPRDPARLSLFTLVTGGHPGPLAAGEQRASLDEVARWGMKRQLVGHALRYRQARAVTKDLTQLHNPLKTATFLRLLARGRCWLEDDSGATRTVSAAYLAALAGRYALDRAGAAQMLRDVARDVTLLTSAVAEAPAARSPRPGQGPPLYLRTDLIFDVEAGGAVAHITGVVNNLEFRCHRPVMATTAPIPLVDPALEVHLIAPARRPAVADDIWRLGFNKEALMSLRALLAGRVPAFIYHRANAYSYAGAMVAHDLGVPLVLEYNGSDAWISRNWGHQPIRREGMVLRIEELNLGSASLIVVVSQALASELVARGVPAGRVLAVPNGVDPERFHPGVDGSAVRARHGIAPDETVVGFVGSFGAWHGAEVLAQAFAQVVARGEPEVRLMMVGDGSRLPAVRSIVEKAALGDRVILTGLVPQSEGPAHMAACDILVAPHVANADGSAFFGSPTKLFEYLAMGKAVIASALDQLGEVVVDGSNGVLVAPGDEAALARAIVNLVQGPELRARLGRQARRDAVEHYTWRRHVDAITARLEELWRE
jgi:glycosyltransferase involved in cell wall biosynthesis